MSDQNQELDDLLGRSGGGSSDLMEYYHAVLARWWVVLLCLALAAMGAFLFLANQPTRFRARSVLFVEQEQSRVLEKVQSVRDEAIRSIDMINTVVDLLQSYPFAERVATRLKLGQDARFLAGLPKPRTGEVSTAEAAGSLMRCAKSAYRTETRLIDIFIDHKEPQIAVTLANAYAEEYLRYVFDRRADANRQANQFLMDEVARLGKKMRKSEEAMQSFRERENAASFETMLSESQSKLMDLEKTILDLSQKVEQFNADIETARTMGGDPEKLLTLSSVASNPQLTALNQAIADQARELLLIAQRYRPKHPTFLAAQTRIDSLNEQRRMRIQEAVASMQASRDRFQTVLEETKTARDEQNKRLLAISGKSIEYNDLKRELDTDRTLHESLLGRLKEIDVTKGLTESPIQIHERAIGALPVRAEPGKVWATAMFLGLAGGIGMALLAHFLDQTIKSVQQAETVTGLSVLAAVPKTKLQRSQGMIATEEERHGLVAESFRSLRASLSLLRASENKRTYLFTSSAPSEGKTFCSVNFATTLCHQGLRTLLIDTDLRKPSLAKVFFGEHRKPGLSEILAGQCTMRQAILSTGIENLSVISAGGRAPNPAELLATEELGELLEQAAAQFDRVVIDSAPLLAVSDTLMIAPKVEVICLVLRASSTNRQILNRALKSLLEIKLRPAGIVLNMMPQGGGLWYYSGKSIGKYGAKGVYGARSTH